ncbi:hypothetical protein PHLGIDRAFT_403013 [Phlebiopsis gigantea 11061_1 CR5-6]|uniref:BTB domain-containing protein n=1 Tax=Phlebiopsis gigantea (strain 11061_1 CR5-6) TaxID=745531 RepID=A0A0C3PMM5_PHLG1|nr:hypothetical protein PHLGIDRAFT_403013 [Phlebiopsis gigantea 11061_1 CR5-6]
MKPSPGNGKAPSNVIHSPSSCLEETLADSILGKPFSDVSLYAFSQRIAPGKVGKPLAVLGNSKIHNPSPASIVQETEDYDYDSDSDLDDSEDSDACEQKASSTSTSTDKGSSPDGATPSQSADHQGVQIVPMRSVAARTLRALILHIYTTEIHFLPLRSRARVENRYEEYVVKARSSNFACSCKSLYRLADEMGFTALKQSAEAHLMSELTERNILDELFSRFSSRYEDILQGQIDVLYKDYWTPATRDLLYPMIERIAEGELPHAARALTLLIMRTPLRLGPLAITPTVSSTESEVSGPSSGVPRSPLVLPRGRGRGRGTSR